MGFSLALAAGLGASAAASPAASAAHRPANAAAVRNRAMTSVGSTWASRLLQLSNGAQGPAGAIGRTTATGARSWQPGLSWSATSKTAPGHASFSQVRSSPQSTTPSPWRLQLDGGTVLIESGRVSCASPGVCYATATTLSEKGAAFLVSTDGGRIWTFGSSPAGQIALDGLSCPAIGTCLLASISADFGQEIWLTHDGGKSWKKLSIPTGVELDAISCRSSRDCIAVGLNAKGAVAIVTTNGSTWTAHDGPAHDAFIAVSCPSASECDAVGQTVAAKALVASSTDGGATWAVAALPATTGALVGIACPSAADCVAVGGRQEGLRAVALEFETSDSGMKWKAVVLPSGQGPVLSVACHSTSDCVAVDEGPFTQAGPSTKSAALLSGNGGHSWRVVALPMSEPTSVACPTASECVTYGSSIAGVDVLLRTSSGGAAWTLAEEPPGELLGGISCSSGTTCVAVGLSGSGAVTETSSNGSSWHEHAVPGYVELVDVSCPIGTMECYAIGASSIGDAVFVSSGDDGVTWHAGQSFGSKTVPDALDCPALGHCYLVLSSASGTTMLEATTNGGGNRTWRSIRVPDSARQFGARISCPSTTECVLVEPAGDVTTTTDSGAKWTTALMPGGILEIFELSCGSATTCVSIAVTTTGHVESLVTTNTGATFLPRAGLSVLPSAIACATASSCELLGGQKELGGNPASLTTSNTAHSWTAQTAPASLGSAGEWLALSCPSAGRCEALALTRTGALAILGLG